MRTGRHLSHAERRDIVMLAALIPVVTIALRSIGFNRLCRRVDRVRADGRAVDAAAVERALALALTRVRRYAPYRGTCLSQSLALCWLLRRRGVPASVRLGARIDDGAFSAHAWVESGSRIVNDAPDVREQFAPFEPLAAGRTATRH